MDLQGIDFQVTDVINGMIYGREVVIPGKPCEIRVLAVHRTTGEEKLIDAILADDSLPRLFVLIREVLGSAWTYGDAWVPANVLTDASLVA